MKRRSVFARLAHLADRRFDDFVRRRFNLAHKPLHIVPYRSFGTRERVVVRGRVLGGAAPEELRGSERPIENLRRTVRDFMTWELPQLELEVSCCGVSVKDRTDDEGHFRTELPVTGDTTEEWHEAMVRVIDARVNDRVDARVEVLTPPLDAQFGIISDLDDTVIQTNVTAKLRMARTVLFGNARTRMPLPGMRYFIEALHRGPHASHRNPIFYVSGGPWNLYTLYRDFLDLQGLPKGPILLADFGIEADFFIHPEHHEHKPARIAEIITTYRNLPFVLIGDSGEQDPEIYVNVAKTHGCVKAIYIRDTAPRANRERFARLAAEAEQHGAAFAAVENASDALLHARGIGLAAGDDHRHFETIH